LKIELILNYPIFKYSCTSQPIVNECSEGDYEWKRGILSWHISVITVESPSATIDFDLNTTLNNDEFFPINCTFKSDANFARIKVINQIIFYYTFQYLPNLHNSVFLFFLSFKDH